MSILVGGVAARHFARLHEVAAQIGTGSRDGRSGKGQSDAACVAAPPAGEPRRGVHADRDAVDDSVHEAHPFVARPGCRPLGPSGPGRWAAASRPAPTSLWAAADESGPPSRSSRLAEVQVPTATSVSIGWTVWPSQSPRNTEARVPVPNKAWTDGSSACTGLSSAVCVLEAQGPAHDSGGPFDGVHCLSSQACRSRTFLGASDPPCRREKTRSMVG